MALNITPGGVGAERVGALSETILTPALQIGKGFGDLPAAAGWMKPFAVTSSLGFNIFAGGSETEELDNSLKWGVTVMYSIPYLQSFVKDVGIPWPFSRLIPIVVFNGQTLLPGHGSGDTPPFPNPLAAPASAVPPGVLGLWKANASAGGGPAVCLPL